MSPPGKPPSASRRGPPQKAAASRGNTTSAVDPRIDPYFVWEEHRRSARAPAAENAGRLVLLELVEGMSARDFARRIARAPAPIRHAIRVSALYRTPPRGLANSRYCSAVVSARFFELLDREPLLKTSIRRVECGFPVPARAAGSRRASPLPEPVPRGPVRMEVLWPSQGARVVVGVIDDGFAVAHARFRNARGGTRVRWMWDQDARNPRGSPLDYGSVYDGAYLDRVVRRCTYDGAVDEDEVYRYLEADDLPSAHRAMRRRVAHGTHVMDLACGADASQASGPAAPAIVAVQLPTLATRDTSGASLAVHIVDALRFILDRVDRMQAEASRPTPAVVNLSYGIIAGPHDGSSVLEAAIDEMLRLRNATADAGTFEVVIPAGNSRQARCHARFAMPRGAARSLPWRILPDDATPSFVEIWVARPAGGGPVARLAVRLTSPDGARSVVAEEGFAARFDDGGGTLMQVIYPEPLPGAMPQVLVAVAPTASADDANVAPSGVWRIDVENVGPRDAEVHAWVQRDDSAPGFVLAGRQSYFDDPAYVRYDAAGRAAETDAPASCVERAGTLNAIATGTRTLVVGGLRGDTLRLAPYAGEGPCLPSATGKARLESDAYAVSDRSPACMGVLAAGTRTGAVVAMNGTSVAAPQITREIAQRMGSGRWPRMGTTAYRGARGALGVAPVRPPAAGQHAPARARRR